MLHSIALRPNPTSETAKNDSTQLRSLVTALEAGKRFLDTLLSLSTDEYPLISFSEWVRVPSVIVLIAKICIPLDMHTATGWDVKAAQDLTRLEISLEVLDYRFQNLSTYDKVKYAHTDFWWAMHYIIGLTRTWYVRKTKPKISHGTFAQFTPSSGSGNTPNTLSCLGPGAMPTPSDGESYEYPVSLNGMDGGASMDFDILSNGETDPFSALKNADFDMEQLFDIGIWGDGVYNSLGFGGGTSF
jgi:hypothetical protein